MRSERNVAKLYRHLDGPLNVPMTCDPKSHGDNDRQNFESEIASRQAKQFFPTDISCSGQFAQGVSESCTVDIFCYVAADHQRYGAFLLRNHHRHRIGFFGDTEAARWRVPQAFPQIRIGANGSRQRTAVTRPF